MKYRPPSEMERKFMERARAVAVLMESGYEFVVDPDDPTKAIALSDLVTKDLADAPRVPRPQTKETGA